MNQNSLGEMAHDLMSTRNAPSKPGMVDKWHPSDVKLWTRVLEVAKGRKREMTRVGPDGPRTIHAPNNGRGFRHWPNPKAIAWAVKQYKGFGGQWKGKGENEKKASEGSALYDEILKLKTTVDSFTHKLADIVSGKVPVGVEGNSGNDMVWARQMGLFTRNVKGIDLFARCEEDARPLIHYLERGGTYGSLEFSGLLGYSAEEIEVYRRYVTLSAELPQPYGLREFQVSAIETLKKGSLITTTEDSSEHLDMLDLESRHIAKLLDIGPNVSYWGPGKRISFVKTRQ